MTLCIYRLSLTDDEDESMDEESKNAKRQQFDDDDDDSASTSADDSCDPALLTLTPELRDSLRKQRQAFGPAISQ